MAFVNVTHVAKSLSMEQTPVPLPPRPRQQMAQTSPCCEALHLSPGKWSPVAPIGIFWEPFLSFAQGQHLTILNSSCDLSDSSSHPVCFLVPLDSCPAVALPLALLFPQTSLPGASHSPLCCNKWPESPKQSHRFAVPQYFLRLCCCVTHLPTLGVIVRPVSLWL